MCSVIIINDDVIDLLTYDIYDVCFRSMLYLSYFKIIAITQIKIEILCMRNWLFVNLFKSIALLLFQIKIVFSIELLLS